MKGARHDEPCRQIPRRQEKRRTDHNYGPSHHPASAACGHAGQCTATSGGRGDRLRVNPRAKLGSGVANVRPAGHDGRLSKPRGHMTPDDYLNRCYDPSDWFRKSRSLRENASALWSKSSNRIDAVMRTETKTASAAEVYSAIDGSIIAKMLYGLAVETALKGRLIEKFPERVRLITEVNGRGSVSRVELRGSEKYQWKTHNLESLADAADAITRGGDSELREALRYFTDCTVWRARYPVPLEIESGKNRPETMVDARQVRLIESFLTHLHSESKTSIDQTDMNHRIQFRPNE